jgi:hypothetical protein
MSLDIEQEQLGKIKAGLGVSDYTAKASNFDSQFK